MTSNPIHEDQDMLLNLLTEEIGKLVVERAELQVVVQTQARRIENLERALLNLSDALAVNLEQ